MIGDKERVEAGLFGDSRAGADCGAARLRTHVANCDCELHREFLHALAAPGSRQDWQACEHPVKLLAISSEATEAIGCGPSIRQATQTVQSRRDFRCRAGRFSPPRARSQAASPPCPVRPDY